MKPSVLTHLMGLAALVCLSVPAAAQQEISAVEAKLRDTLRATTLQLRNIEAERARLDAELTAVKAQSEKKIKDLTTQLDSEVKRAEGEKTLADKIIGEQKATIVARDSEIDTLQKLLEKWKIAHIQITDIARAKESERAKFESKSISLQRTVDARERQNVELYQLGKEVIERYENFALGRALLAREPFTGLAKVRLEEQIQDYKDKADDSLAKLGGEAPAAPAPEAPEAAGDETVPPAP